MNEVERATAIRDKWIAWEGIEVEGRLRGIHSLFVRDPFKIDPDKIPHSHVLVSPILVKNRYWIWVRRLLEMGKVVTMEVPPEDLKKLPVDILENKKVVIMLDITDPVLVKAVRLLKGSDMVRFGRFNTNLFEKRLGVTANVFDYEDDVEWVPEG